MRLVFTAVRMPAFGKTREVMRILAHPIFSAKAENYLDAGEFTQVLYPPSRLSAAIPSSWSNVAAV